MSINYNATKNLKGFPVGSIIVWSGDISSVPKGWLSCTGSVRQVADYPMLYDIIGNTYGGTVGSTFTLPNLTQGRAITDTYQGHYSYLKTKGSAHYETESTTLATDPFWNQIGTDTNNTTVFNFQSEIDVVGSFLTKPNLVATVTGITLEKGSYFAIYGIHPRKLGDKHQSQSGHTHPLVTSEPDSQNSFIIGSQKASTCSAGYTPTGRWGYSCLANNSGCHYPKTVGTRRVTNTAANCVVKGGASSLSNGLGMVGPSTTGATAGDGVVQGQMYANTISPGSFYASSLSNPETTTWANVGAHLHNHPGSTFKCNIGVQQSYTFYDISSTNVNMIQPSGTEATININTETPSLTMLFIIKAY